MREGTPCALFRIPLLLWIFANLMGLFTVISRVVRRSTMY